MSGVPADLLMPSDFVTLRMGLVDEVGFDAAVLLERVRWRCEIRPEGWVATYAELSEDTRLGPGRLKAAVAVLRERGWLVSENAGTGSRTLRWSVVHAGQDPNGQSDPLPKRSDQTYQTDDLAVCSLHRENLENKTPATSAEEPVILTLVASGDEPQAALFASSEVAKPETWPPAATENGCRGVFLSEWEAHHGPIDPSIKRQALGRIGQLAKDRGNDLGAWRSLWDACKAAGRGGRWNMGEFLAPAPQSRFPQRTNHYLALAEQAAQDGLLDDMRSWNNRPALGGPA